MFILIRFSVILFAGSKAASDATEAAANAAVKAAVNKAD